MKIRIQGNSLRLRLTQSEVRRFADQGKVEEQIQFGLAPGEQLSYALEKYSGTSIQATYQAGKISVHIPANIAQQWTSTEEVGISSSISLAPDQELHLLIEKDFHCIKPRAGEDEGDHFPNPEMKI